MDDGRRRQYVPLATHFATAKTGTRIQEDLGLEGLAVWACTLAAAKKSQLQGTLIWTCDADAWSLLGISGHPPDFTFDTFVTLLGRLKQARTRKVGQEKHTTLTRFGQWNYTIRSQHDASRKRSKRAQNTADNVSPIGTTEGEGEGETPLPPIRKTKSARNGTHPLACPTCGETQRNRSELDDHLEYVHPQQTPSDWIDELAPKDHPPGDLHE